MTIPILVNQASDPAELGWPASLPLELALAQASVREICEAHGVSRATYQALKLDAHFQAAVSAAIQAIGKEGVSFRIKAQAQAEELLKTSWGLIHAPLEDVPASVKADLIKFTVRASGLDASIDQKAKATAQAVGNQNNLQINIHLGE